MSKKESKTVELNDEQLGSVSGGLTVMEESGYKHRIDPNSDYCNESFKAKDPSGAHLCSNCVNMDWEVMRCVYGHG